MCRRIVGLIDLMRIYDYDRKSSKHGQPDAARESASDLTRRLIAWRSLLPSKVRDSEEREKVFSSGRALFRASARATNMATLDRRFGLQRSLLSLIRFPLLLNSHQHINQ